MGTDIKIYVEKRFRDVWHLAEPAVEEPWEPGEYRPKPPPRPTELFWERNYALYSVLADVRNHLYGRPRMVPIAKPRGLPPDMSPELSAWATWWGETDDASWLLSRELQELPWDTMTCQCEATTRPELARLFGDPTLPFPVSRWPPEEPRLYGGHIERDGIMVAWTETYAERIGKWFVVDVMNRLRACGPPA